MYSTRLVEGVQWYYHPFFSHISFNFSHSLCVYARVRKRVCDALYHAHFVNSMLQLLLLLLLCMSSISNNFSFSCEQQYNNEFVYLIIVKWCLLNMIFVYFMKFETLSASYFSVYVIQWTNLLSRLTQIHQPAEFIDHWAASHKINVKCSSLTPWHTTLHTHKHTYHTNDVFVHTFKF